MPKVIFDVGANDGSTALALVKHFDPHVVYAFEPVESTFAALQEGTKNEARIKAFRIALSDNIGNGSMNCYNGSVLASLCDETPVTSVKSDFFVGTEQVELTTLDTFCMAHKINEIGLLKIDTEGHDLAVLKGSHRLLSERKIGFIIVEFYKVTPDNPGEPGCLNAMDELLCRSGYRFVASYTDFVNARVPVGVYNALYTRTTT